MHTTLGQIINFGHKGNAADYEIFGWSLPEDGFTWTDGPAAGLLLPSPTAPYGFAVEISVAPHRDRGRLAGQSLILNVNGVECGRGFVTERVKLAWYVRPLPANVRSLTLILGLPDASVPTTNNDTRRLGLSVLSIRIFCLTEPYPIFSRRMAASPVSTSRQSAADRLQRWTGMTAGDLAMRLESLGHDCTTGFFQRFCGVEPLGLLRFSGTLQYALIEGLDSSFEHLGNKDKIDPVPEETTLKDWVVYERHYLLRYHTWVDVADATREEMVVRETKRLSFLKRKFLEDLQMGHKVFVYHNRRAVPLEEVLPLFLAIKRHGSAPLLVLAPADDDHPPGMVKEILPGLMTGHITKFNLDGADDPAVKDWLAVFTSAILIIDDSTVRGPPAITTP